MDRSRRQGARGVSAPPAPPAPPRASRLTIRPSERSQQPSSATATSLWQRLPKPAQIADCVRSCAAAIAAGARRVRRARRDQRHRVGRLSLRHALAAVRDRADRACTATISSPTTRFAPSLPIHVGDNVFDAGLDADRARAAREPVDRSRRGAPRAATHRRHRRPRARAGRDRRARRPLSRRRVRPSVQARRPTATATACR